MNLELEIKKILELEKFQNLTEDDKKIVFESILANCLILSEANRERFLRLLQNNLRSIVNLKDSFYYRDGQCYAGIVEARVIGHSATDDDIIYPYEYDLKYKEYPSPFQRLTRAILHEFGHVVVKKEALKLDTIFFDMGGLTISKLLKNDYGHFFSEIINEYTTFLAFKAYLSYHPDSNQKLREFASQMGFGYEEQIDYLNILSSGIYTTSSELDLASSETSLKMFNYLYTKYTPLIKLIMHAFQNTLFQEQDLIREFQKGHGLDAKLENVPINDLLYGYYQDAFHTETLFDAILGDREWEKFCREADSKLLDTDIDMAFIESAIDKFKLFYEKRVDLMLKDKKITPDVAEQALASFYNTVLWCQKYYSKTRTK